MFWKKIFKKSKSAEKEKSRFNKSEALLADIQKTSDECRSDIETAKKEIEMLQKQAKEVIVKIFKVSKEYWYEELKYYNNIKQEQDSDEITPEVIRKADEVIEGYKQQIKLRKTKIDFCNSLLKKYTNAEKKLQKKAELFASGKDESGKLEYLEQHARLISEMNHEDSNLQKAFEQNELYKMIDEDVKEIEDDIKLRAEIKRQMNELNKLYDGADTRSADTYIKAVNELKRKMDEQ